MTLEQLSAAATCPNSWCASDPKMHHCPDQATWQGYCAACGVEAPEKSTEADAWAVWNDRGQLVAVQPVERVVVGTVTSPSCMACEGTPKEGNNPCAVCGRRVQPDDATVERCRKGSCKRHNACMYAPCFATPLFRTDLTEKPVDQFLTENNEILRADITRLRAELAEARAKAFEEAAEACEAERLCEPQDENNAAYDNAIDHCVEAIRAMIDKEATMEGVGG